MTFEELLITLLRKWYVFLAITLATYFGTTLYIGSRPDDYQAKAVIYVSDNISRTNELAKKAVRSIEDSYPDVVLSRTSVVSSKRTTIVAKSPSSAQSVEAANAAAQKTAKLIAKKLPDTTVDVREATMAEDVSLKTNPQPYMRLSLVVGLVVSLSTAIIWGNIDCGDSRTGLKGVHMRRA